MYIADITANNLLTDEFYSTVVLIKIYFKYMKGPFISRHPRESEQMALPQKTISQLLVLHSLHPKIKQLPFRISSAPTDFSR